MSSGMSKLNEPCMLTARHIIPNMTMCPVQADVAWIVACLAHAAQTPVAACPKTSSSSSSSSCAVIVHVRCDMLNYVQCVGACYVLNAYNVLCLLCCICYVITCCGLWYVVFVTYAGKPCYAMIRQTTWCYDMVSNVMIQQQHVLWYNNTFIYMMLCYTTTCVMLWHVDLLGNRIQRHPSLPNEKT